MTTEPAARNPQFPPARLSICPAYAQHRTRVERVGPSGLFMVGRADACDIVIPDDPAVSRRHIRLQAHAGILYMTVVPGAKAYVNKRECLEQGLADGDIIRLGDTLLTVSYPPLDGRRTDDPRFNGHLHRAQPSRTDVGRAVLAVAGRHGEHLGKLRRSALDEELGELLGLSAARARRLLDETANELGVGADVTRAARYVAVAERLRGR